MNYLERKGPARCVRAGPNLTLAQLSQRPQNRPSPLAKLALFSFPFAEPADDPSQNKGLMEDFAFLMKRPRGIGVH